MAMDDSELLDIMVTMVGDLRMKVSQTRELVKREISDSKGSFKAQAIGRANELNWVYDDLDKILKEIKQLGMQPSKPHKAGGE